MRSSAVKAERIVDFRPPRAKPPELLVDDTGTITLPPDVLLEIGGPGRFELPDIGRDMLHLERVAEDRVDVGESVSMRLADVCPACFHNYGESEEQLCPECGSSRPMVQA